MREKKRNSKGILIWLVALKKVIKQIIIILKIYTHYIKINEFLFLEYAVDWLLSKIFHLLKGIKQKNANFIICLFRT